MGPTGGRSHERRQAGGGVGGDLEALPSYLGEQ